MARQRRVAPETGYAPEVEGAAAGHALEVVEVVANAACPFLALFKYRTVASPMESISAGG